MSTTTLPAPAATAQTQTASSAALTEVVYTICPVFVASHVAVELGWLDEELRKAGASLKYLRSLSPEIGWLPHFSHKLDNLFRDGGNIPSIWAHADNVRTRLIGLTWSPAGGRILTRADSGIYRVAGLRGRKFGLSKSLNADKVDWWRGTGERSIEVALGLAGLTRKDVEIVDIGNPDNIGLGNASKPADLWTHRRRDDLYFTPEVQALRDGKVDAVYSSYGRALALERTGEFKSIEDLENHPDWTLQIANSPWALTVNADLADSHPEIVVAFLRASLRAGRWVNANREAAATILHRVTYYPTVEDTARAIRHVDFVHNLSPRNLAGIGIEKEFLLTHGYIKRDFDVNAWAAHDLLAEAHRSL
ncbi:ABC-type nitrate/sulfonate/bicarbonate transport system, periplasmic component [Opitutaceae bacterium TAV1]|nr:ABC-type nitrate/sulfonate/bicarbonate transport system, periplasmic component [Opitutaceae bacterium TAV1]